ncbi:MAG TPA: hypothetical protein VET89_09885, partial [Stellaceae bacterium]|nr:hypothetical protein [Stellaceae bacterium]
AYAYYPPAPSAPTPAPSTYTPAAPQAMAVPPAPSSTSSAAAGITYTSKPAFTNSAGQTCREYKSSSSGRDVFGTACRQSDGQWRVVN